MHATLVVQRDEHAVLYDAIDPQLRALASLRMPHVDAVHGVQIAVTQDEARPVGRQAGRHVQTVVLATHAEQ